jgi:DNA-directed RNA polymerase beta subunit
VNPDAIRKRLVAALGIQEEPAVKQSAAAARPPRVVEDDPHDVSAGLDSILHSTKKLLAVNRGEAEPDERDSLMFRKILGPDKLMSERVQLDAGKLRLNAMRRLSRMRTLKGLTPGHFDGYATGLIVGNPLSSPLEEINPMHLVEQARRITQMGPGGLPSEESISSEAQSLHPSSFGFLDILAGPESSRIGVDTRAAWGTKIGSDGKIYQRFLDRRKGVHRWLSPEDLHGKTLGIPD